MNTDSGLDEQMDLGSEGDFTSPSSFNFESPDSTVGEFETAFVESPQCQLVPSPGSLASHIQQEVHDDMGFIESFPTQRAQRIARMKKNAGVTSGLGWIDFQRPGNITSHKKMQRALETMNILREVRRSLDIPVSVESRQTQNGHPYLLDNIRFAKQREVDYSALFLRKNLTKEEIQWRNVQVKWILKASTELKLEIETTLIACFYVDGFLHRQQVRSSVEMEALAYAALLAASKLEEVIPVRLKVLFDKFFSVLKFQKRTVLLKEMELLSVLKFQSCPPTAKFMLDAALTRDNINFLPGTKSYIEDLSLVLIFMSLSEVSFSRLKPSVKALTALEVASEFVMYHWDERAIYSQDYRVREKHVVSNSTISASYEVLCDLLKQKVSEI